MRKDRGFVLLGAMIVLMVLAGFLGLMADTAHLQYARQQAQTAADAAAVAAIRESLRGNTGGMLEAARGDAARNGLRDGDGGIRVQINAPPRSGEFTASTAAVEATITRTAPTLFMRIFGPAAVTVAARSVAIVNPGGRVTLGE